MTQEYSGGARANPRRRRMGPKTWTQWVEEALSAEATDPASLSSLIGLAPKDAADACSDTVALLASRCLAMLDAANFRRLLDLGTERLDCDEFIRSTLEQAIRSAKGDATSWDEPRWSACAKEIVDYELSGKKATTGDPFWAQALKMSKVAPELAERVFGLIPEPEKLGHQDASALFLAIRIGNLGVSKLLLSRGASLPGRMTLLGCAACSCNPQLASWALSLGADPGELSLDPMERFPFARPPRTPRDLARDVHKQLRFPYAASEDFDATIAIIDAALEAQEIAQASSLAGSSAGPRHAHRSL